MKPRRVIAWATETFAPARSRSSLRDLLAMTTVAVGTTVECVDMLNLKCPRPYEMCLYSPTLKRITLQTNCFFMFFRRAQMQIAICDQT